MRIPAIKGIIKRRLLVNFRAVPEVVQRFLPSPFRPKLQRGHSIVGVCLIRLEEIRPVGLPGFIGISSENAAHRIAVQWTDGDSVEREGVFIPRRDTGSWLNRLAGGRVFPGEHHSAQFAVTDDGRHIDFEMHSSDGRVNVRVAGTETDEWPADSCFESLAEASAFFEGGSLGYSVTGNNERFDGLRLHTPDWHVRALAISSVHSSYFADPGRFPGGSIEFDHALVMRNVLHEWHQAEDLYGRPQPAEAGQLP
jgi:Uncharacterized conserved protein (COG2071)